MDFVAPALLRLLGALVLTGAGWGAVWLVEGRRITPAATPVAASTASTTRTVTLDFTASQSIAAWSVSSVGVAIPGVGDTTTWRGTATLPNAACDVLVEATPLDPSAGTWALRLRSEGRGARGERTTWASGTQVELVSIPAAP
jgi:hypothetical protein